MPKPEKIRAVRWWCWRKVENEGVFARSMDALMPFWEQEESTVHAPTLAQAACILLIRAKRAEKGGAA